MILYLENNNIQRTLKYMAFDAGIVRDAIAQTHKRRHNLIV